MSRSRSVGWLALGVSCLATLVAMGVQQWLRNAWQVRVLPERLMETLLVLVPLDLFERGLQQFGASAKDIALVGTYVGMAAFLVVAGWLAVRTLNAWVCIGLGFGLWLLAMLVVLPLTGAGVFGTGLLVSPVLTSAGYLCVFAAYGVVLAFGTGAVAFAGGMLTRPGERQPQRSEEPRPREAERQSAATVGAIERRSLLAGVGGLIVGFVAFGVARNAASAGVQSSLPLAAAPTNVPAPTAQPTATITTAVQTPVAATPTPVPTIAPASTATPVVFPTPAPVRTVARDQDGSLTAAGRPQGNLAPAVTNTSDFYIVTKNAIADPVVDASTWRLIIDGEVAHPVQVDYATLIALPSVEITKTLECISNLTAGCNMASFGCDLMSTAAWRGVAVSDLLNLAGGLKSGVVDVAFMSIDEFSAGLPADTVLDPMTLVVYQMNGQVLPREHGYPARLLVPGRYGMKNPKWLAGIRALNQPYADWYQQRGWTRDGIVKTMSRIDVPADGSGLMAGSQPVAGIAYAGNRGIKLVEVSADGGGTWSPARFIEPPAGSDCMVRWQATFEMGDKPLMLVVRATDGSGVVQPDDFGLPAPDGSWGQDSITVNPA